MSETLETIAGVAIFGAILLASALVTNWFARTMYRKCQECGTLNARRRSNCRECGKPLV
jgi:hypothetical protein